ncbi:MAG: ATP-binding protein [Deltaproteobacteria bacterium]|nr:ATP-binding protein [Deltaproteobacteria bacterium]
MGRQYGNLKPAHRGYRYQDIATAFFLVQAVVECYDHVVVDKKQVNDDRLDDLEVMAKGRRVRRQIKSSSNKDRSIKNSDFTSSDSTLRIDRLVFTHIQMNTNVTEYRLCATWQPPEQNDSLSALLIEVDAEPSFPDTDPLFYKLDINSIWPEGKQPIWGPLHPDAGLITEIKRGVFLEFCEKFLIELNLPLSSEDLLVPGPLEKSILSLLQEKVGIGTYPNQGRLPEDVAALAISLANLARTQESTLTPKDVASNLGIRIDYGRIAQTFPFDSSYFHDRPQFRKLLRSKIQCGGTYLIIAPPGAGKSWELTRLAEEMIATQAIVAKHYCYLDPSDELIERRVTSEVFYGNLLAELHEAAKGMGLLPNRLSADSINLEETLRDLVALGKPVILIVDGLDHITRVQSSSKILSDDETDIVERLATLNIPDGVALVLGSQPGPHLDLFRTRQVKDFIEYELPSWDTQDSIALARLHGVDQALKNIGVSDLLQVESILQLLAERSDGNPLYTKYLSRGLVIGLNAGSITDSYEWLQDTPEIQGNIAIYYKHLYENIIDDAKAVADLFGTIDFSVSESELREIFPPFMAPWILQALAVLSPVIKTSVGQGGMRIFHESFRRFMLDELISQGRNLGDVLDPVINWLVHCGFYKDARCYRFLFLALLRSGRGAEVFQYVGITFISKSVAHGYTAEPIQKNLALAADIAGRNRDWPMLVRCGELRRSLYTCFDTEDNFWKEFWEIYANLYGPAALAERLLFDGKPTLNNEGGVLVCSIIDKMGCTAPWREYLELPVSAERGGGGLIDDNLLTEDETLDLAILHGRLRLGNGWRVIRRFYKYLAEQYLNPNRLVFIRKLAALLSRMGYSNIVLKLAQRAYLALPTKPPLNPIISVVLTLGVIDEYEEERQNREIAQGIISLVVPYATTPELAIACVEYGADPDLLSNVVVAPSSIPICVASDNHFENANNIRCWVASIRLLAAIPGSIAALDAERQRVQGIGWYRCWLLFVIETAKAEAAYRENSSFNIKNAFKVLAEDVRPFAGKPRPCDLYQIHNVISDTLSRSLSLVKTDSEWRYAIKTIMEVSEGTGSRLDREDGGPVPIGTVIDILLPHSNNPIVGKHIRSAIQQQVEIANKTGTYYSTHATFSLQLAKIQMHAGQNEDALKSLEQAAIYFAAYGWHKDITLFDVIESAPVLKADSKNIALKALEDLQPLVAAAILHTDGRETKRCPNAWFRSLLKIDPQIAIELLGRTILQNEGIENWVTNEALEYVVNQLMGKADPILLDALWETIHFEIEYDNVSQKITEARLAPIKTLFKTHPDLAAQRLVRLAAEVADDDTQKNAEAVSCIKKFAAELDQPIVCDVSSDSAKRAFSKYSKELKYIPTTVFTYRSAVFPENAMYVDLLVGLRKLSGAIDTNDRHAFSSIVQYFGYKLEEMSSQGRESDAIRLLRFWAHERELSPYSDIHPLADLALYLDNAQCATLAVTAYTLAYVSTRGGHGWLSLGDRSHSAVLTRAIELDRDLTLQIVADEIARQFRYLDYGAGISRHLIERIGDWGEPDIATASWKEAFNVIAHRLPLSRPSYWFAVLDLQALPSWNLDQSLIAMLLIRLAEPRQSRKLSALSGIFKAIRYCPGSVAVPLIWWLSRDTPISSILLVFHLLLLEEKPPYEITTSAKESIFDYARAECWGTALLARLLLNRINSSVPPPCLPCQPLNTQDLSKHEIDLALSLDTENIIPVLAERWPELAENVAKRFHQFFKPKVQGERINERLKLAYGRNGEAYPPTPVLYWQNELFISALHTELTGLYEKYWKSKNEVCEEEISLLLQTLPHLPLHLAYFNSRVPRPAWDKPSQMMTGEGQLSMIPDDPRFPGWIRLGMIEWEYLQDGHSFSRPVESVGVFIGTLAVPMGRILSDNLFPLVKGDSATWWMASGFFISRPDSDEIIHLIGLNKHTDWLSDIRLLIPPIELSILLNLQPLELGGALVWLENDGNTAVALRKWRVEGNQFDAESDMLKGSDLIVRPDIFAKLQTLYKNPLLEFRQVFREPIPSK